MNTSLVSKIFTYMHSILFNRTPSLANKIYQKRIFYNPDCDLPLKSDNSHYPIMKPPLSDYENEIGKTEVQITLKDFPLIESY